MFQPHLGARLRLYRSLRGKTQEELAAEIGASKQHLGQIERGECNPSLDLVAKVSLALNIAPAIFFLGQASFGTSSECCLPSQSLRHHVQPVSGYGTWIINTSSGLNYWSETFCRILGHATVRCPSVQKFLQHLTDEDSASFAKYYHRAMAGVDSLPFVTFILRRDGIQRLLQIQCDIVEHGFETVACFVIADISDLVMTQCLCLRNQHDLEAVIEEKTESLSLAVEQAREELARRTAAEALVREQDCQLQRLMNAVPVILYSFERSHADRALHLVHVWGSIAHEFFAERPGQCWQERIHPLDQERVRHAFASATSDTPITLEYRVLDLKGAWRWIQDAVTLHRDGHVDVFLGVITDISLSKAMEMELRRSTRLYQDLAEDAPVYICRYDRDCRLIYCNKAYAQFLSATDENVEGFCFLDLIPAGDREELVRALGAVTPDSPICRTEHRAKGTDGQLHWQRWTDRAFFDESGVVMAYQGVGEDISKHKRLEAELLNTRTMLEHGGLARIGVWEKNVLSGLSYWSAVTRDIYEVGPEYAPRLDSTLEFHPDDGSRERIVRAVQEAMYSGKRFDLEVPLRTAKGRFLWVCVTGQGEMREGICVRLFGTVQDVTTQRRIRDALQVGMHAFLAFSAAAPEPIVVSSIHGVILHANQALADLAGYRVTELQGLHTADLYVEQTQNWLAALQGNVGCAQREIFPLPIRSKSGETINVCCTYWKGFWNDQQCVFWVCAEPKHVLLSDAERRGNEGDVGMSSNGERI